MTDNDVKQILIDFDGLLNGHFALTSGKHSDTYFQCAKLYQHPPVVENLAQTLAKKIDFDFDTVIAPAIGGVIFGYEIASATGKRNLFVERNKEGKMELRRGYVLKEGERVLIVEDVITTGTTILETIEAIKPYNVKLSGVACIVDRTASKKDMGKITSLLKIDPVLYDEDDCPLCKLGLEIEKPGSRKK